MKAIVICYEGIEANSTTLSEMIATLAHLMRKDNYGNYEKPVVTQFNERDIENLLVKNASAIKVQKIAEEKVLPQDMAAVFLAKKFKRALTPTSTTFDLSAKVAEAMKSDNSPEFKNAMEIISENYDTVSEEVLLKNHINKIQLLVIAKTYELNKKFNGAYNS